MSDQSSLDKKYFIDEKVYNCPFCKRNNVMFNFRWKWEFNWDNVKICYYFKTECSSCEKESLHLTYNNIFWDYCISLTKVNKFNWNADNNIDELCFYHQPSSFFTIDNRIHKKIRDLMSEADWCLKMSYLVWAYACLRKAIYELIALESVESVRSNWYIDYTDSIKKLKWKFSFVEWELFDAMWWIQELISDNIHEKSWDKRDSWMITNILSLLKEILNEMYIIPADRTERMKLIPLLKDQKEKDKSKE